MQYDINFRSFVEQYLPSMLRKPKRLALFYAFMAPLKQLHHTFLQLRSSIDFDTKYTSETICVEEKLNVLFDPILKRIEIATNDDEVERVYIFGHDEIIEPSEKVYIYGHAEVIDDADKVYVYGRTEIMNPFDFTVYVPSAVNSEFEASIRLEIEKYRFAGKRYQITLT